MVKKPIHTKHRVLIHFKFCWNNCNLICIETQYANFVAIEMLSPKLEKKSHYFSKKLYLKITEINFHLECTH